MKFKDLKVGMKVQILSFEDEGEEILHHFKIGDIVTIDELHDPGNDFRIKEESKAANLYGWDFWALYAKNVSPVKEKK